VTSAHGRLRSLRLLQLLFGASATILRSVSGSVIVGRLCPTRPVGPRDGGGLTQILPVVLGLTCIALCRPLPPEDHRRDLIGAWLRPD
jgi:hypothetical protein